MVGDHGLSRDMTDEASPRRAAAPTGTETGLLPPPQEWIMGESFTTTADVAVPEKLLDQVIGQDHAVTVVRKAAEQKRHVMLIGDPGTGKSMLARAMTEFLPKEELEDVIAYPNPEDQNTPRNLYALGATYARAGDTANALTYLRRARAQAQARNQGQLLISIDRDLQALEAVARP